MSLKLLKDHTKEQHTQSLANYLPNGRAFVAKNINNTNLRKFLQGLGPEYKRFEENINAVSSEYDPRTTTDFIDEWERSVGIPDDCFSGLGTIEDRRLHVFLKLASLNISTEQDVLDLAEALGFTASITPGIESITFPVTFPIPMFNTVKDARFTIVIDITGGVEPEVFPYTFPITFGSENGTILECLLNQLMPANVNVTIRYL